MLISKHEDCDTPRFHAKDNAFLNKTFPLGIYIHWWNGPWNVSSSGWTVQALSACPRRRAGPGPSTPWWSLVHLCLSCIGESRPGRSTTVLQENPRMFLSQKNNCKGESFIDYKKQTEHPESLGDFIAQEISALIPGGPSYHTVHSVRHRHSAFKRIPSQLFIEPTCLCKSSEPPCQSWGIWITLTALLKHSSA